MQEISEKVEVNNGWDYPSHPNQKRKERLDGNSINNITVFCKISTDFMCADWHCFYDDLHSVGDSLFCAWDIRISITSKSDKGSE